MYAHMKNKQTKSRKMVTTTIRDDLWKGIQCRAIQDGRNVNDILEELIDFYLRWTGELVRLYTPSKKGTPWNQADQRRVFELAFVRLKEELRNKKPYPSPEYPTPEEAATLGKQFIEVAWSLVNPDTYYDCGTAWR